jgi:hypothetical protein
MSNPKPPGNSKKARTSSCQQPVDFGLIEKLWVTCLDRFLVISSSVSSNSRDLSVADRTTGRTGPRQVARSNSHLGALARPTPAVKWQRIHLQGIVQCEFRPVGCRLGRMTHKTRMRHPASGSLQSTLLAVHRTNLIATSVLVLTCTPIIQMRNQVSTDLRRAGRRSFR